MIGMNPIFGHSMDITEKKQFGTENWSRGFGDASYSRMTQLVTLPNSTDIIAMGFNENHSQYYTTITRMTSDGNISWINTFLNDTVSNSYYYCLDAYLSSNNSLYVATSNHNLQGGLDLTLFDINPLDGSINNQYFILQNSSDNANKFEICEIPGNNSGIWMAYCIGKPLYHAYVSEYDLIKRSTTWTIAFNYYVFDDVQALTYSSTSNKLYLLSNSWSVATNITASVIIISPNNLSTERKILPKNNYGTCCGNKLILFQDLLYINGYYTNITTDQTWFLFVYRLDFSIKTTQIFTSLLNLYMFSFTINPVNSTPVMVCFYNGGLFNPAQSAFQVTFYRFDEINNEYVAHQAVIIQDITKFVTIQGIVVTNDSFYICGGSTQFIPSEQLGYVAKYTWRIAAASNPTPTTTNSDLFSQTNLIIYGIVGLGGFILGALIFGRKKPLPTTPPTTSDSPVINKTENDELVSQKKNSKKMK
jgi:hypothetical protein